MDQNTSDLRKEEARHIAQDEALERCRARWLEFQPDLEEVYRNMLNVAEDDTYDFTEELMDDIQNVLEGI